MTYHEARHDAVTTELLDWIQAGIDRLCRSTHGLTEAQVRLPAAPSGWTIAGLVGHVHDSTHFWLHHVIAGHPMTVHEDDPWDNDPPIAFAALLNLLHQDTATARTSVEHLAHNASPGWWPQGAWGGYRQTTVRGVLIHLLNDNAAHTGQLDIAREQLDGGVWDYSRNGIRQPTEET